MELNGCLKIMIFHFVDTIALSCKTNNEIKQLAIQTYHDLDQGFPTFSWSRTTFMSFLVARTTMHVGIIKINCDN